MHERASVKTGAKRARDFPAVEVEEDGTNNTEREGAFADGEICWHGRRQRC